MRATLFSLRLITYFIALLCSITFINVSLAQQKTPKDKLLSQLGELDSAFRQGNTQRFNQIVPLADLQEIYSWAINEKVKTVSGKSRIVAMDKDSADVFLSGLFLYGNSGDETNLSGSYSGIYRFAFSNGAWRLTNRIEIDRLNKINHQNIGMVVIPEKEVIVIDTLTIDVNDRIGFLAKLNHRATLSKLSLNGSKVDYVFDGGMLWVNAQSKKNQQLIIEYVLKVENDKEDTNSSYFGARYGHMRNQYFWHPFFSFSSPNDRAHFSVKCEIPKDFQLSTSLPQNDQIYGDKRMITAKSELPTFGLSVYYDQDWAIHSLKKDQIEMVVHATAGFAPKYDALHAQFSKDYDRLEKSFGKPISKYFGIVQDRTGGNGWKNRANSIIVAGETGSYFITDQPSPRAVFGHEVAHGWTNPTGPATNFLMEGWATYAESILLKAVYGDRIITTFFQSQKRNYLNGEFDGHRNLWDDYSNNGISYSKGAWLFYLLENQLGSVRFSNGIKNFISGGNHTIQSFILAMSKAADKNMEPFLLAWLKSKQIPSLKVHQSNTGIEIEQQGEVLPFPLEVQLKLKDGRSISKTLEFTTALKSLTINEKDIESYVLDPQHKLLYQLK
jgi:hypothetical protein